MPTGFVLYFSSHFECIILMVSLARKMIPFKITNSGTKTIINIPKAIQVIVFRKTDRPLFMPATLSKLDCAHIPVERENFFRLQRLERLLWVPWGWNPICTVRYKQDRIPYAWVPHVYGFRIGVVTFSFEVRCCCKL